MLRAPCAGEVGCHWVMVGGASNESSMALEHSVAELLTARGLRLAVVETTTGGLICARLTAVPGSSKFLDSGLVAYSKSAKRQWLGIEETLLNAHGSVSEAVAIAMAQAVRERSGVDLGLAETGIAGPKPGRSPKPVGTCYLALATAAATHCIEVHCDGDRAAIRHGIVERALALIVETVNAAPR